MGWGRFAELRSAAGKAAVFAELRSAHYRVIGVVALGLAISACSASQTPGPSLTQSCVTCPSYSKLQFAVGTANLYGTASGLNVVSTLRQPSGTSALGVDTPTITGPFTVTAAPQPANGAFTDPFMTVPDEYLTTANGPSLAEAANGSIISGTPQSVAPGTPYCDTIAQVSGFTTCPAGISPNASTFGESGGVFAMGIAPYNARAETAQAYSYAPYAQPFYDTTGHQQFVPWGGPPAFDPDNDHMGTRDGLVPQDDDTFVNFSYYGLQGFPYFLGVGEGVTAFENVTPQTGTYTLAIQIGVAGPGGPTYKTISTTASLNSVALLPTVTAPVVTPDANGDGGASVVVSVPAGVTEALVQITDWGPGGGPTKGSAGNDPQMAVGNCHGPKGEAFAPVYYTLDVTSSGTYPLPTTDGPNTNLQGGINNLVASPTICTAADNNNPPGGIAPVDVGDNITVQMIGFDYPDYEAAVSLTANKVPQAPAIVGANGQSDITISVPMEEDWPSYTPIGLSRTYHPMHRHGAVPHRIHHGVLQRPI